MTQVSTASKRLLEAKHNKMSLQNDHDEECMRPETPWFSLSEMHQSQKAQGFCVADFATPGDERRSRSKLRLMKDFFTCK